MLLDLPARDDLPFAQQQILEQREQLGRESHVASAAPHRLRTLVQLQIRRRQLRRPLRVFPPPQRFNTRDQFLDGKRLHKIVVRAQPQSGHAIFDRILRREKKHRRFLSRRPQPFEHFAPIHSREHDVEDDHVVVMILRHLPGLRAVAGRIHRKPRRPERLGHGLA